MEKQNVSNDPGAKAGASTGEAAGRAARPKGRPRLSDDELRVVGFKIPAAELATFDAYAELQGQTRSQRLRMLIEHDLGIFE